MLDIRWIRENPEALDKALANRGAEPAAERLVALDVARRAAVQKAQDAQTRRNAVSKEIGQAKAAKDETRAQTLMEEVAQLKDAIKAGEDEEKAATKALEDALAQIPNVPHDDVPVGPDETANVEARRWGEPKRMNWAKEHFELGEAMGLMDFETAAKLSGSRFVVLKGQLARMERALGQFMLDLHTGEHGYTEVQPPLLVKDDALFGTAQLPKFGLDQFETVGNLLRLEIDLAFRRATYLEKQSALRRVQQIYELLNAKMRDAKANRQDVSWSSSTFTALSTLFTAISGEFREGYELFTAIEQSISELRKRGERKLFLIPTSEVPLTNLVPEQILDEACCPFATPRSPLLPLRGRLRRARYARHDAGASVQQGGARLHHHARTEPAGARAHDRMRGGGAAPADLAFPTVSCSAPATWALHRRKPTT